MKYRAMAKWYIFEAAKRSIPDYDWDARHLGEGFNDGKPLTTGEMNKFIEVLNDELDHMEQDLHNRKIIA